MTNHVHYRQRMKLVAVVVALLVFACPALVFAAPKACSCKNLESIQQELKNALYLEKFMTQLSKKVADAEEEQRQLKKKEPNNPVSRRSVRDVSKEVWTKEKAKLRVPKVPGDEATFFFPRFDDSGAPLLTTANKELVFNVTNNEINIVTNFRLDISKFVVNGKVEF